MEEKSSKIPITILIASYNPDKSKLFKTIKSVLIQDKLTYEIVIADDGSVHDYFEEIKQFFYDKNFRNYKLIKNPNNIGTVRNIYSGIKMASGQYVKLISPGDYIIGQYTLKKWYTNIVETNADLSFGNVIYYNIIDEKFNIIKYKASPQLPNVYKDKKEKVTENYILLDDTIHGASVLCKKSLYEKYLFEALNKVIYAEDCLYRLMVCDGIHIFYYSKDVILYEYGTGISTKMSEQWQAKIKKDLKATDDMIIDRLKDKQLLRKFLLTIKERDNKKLKNKIKRYYSNPVIFIKKFFIKTNIRYTHTVLPEKILNQLKNENILP